MAPCKEKNELRHTATGDNGRVLDVAVESVSRHTATEWNAARHTATEKKESWHTATGDNCRELDVALGRHTMVTPNGARMCVV